MLTKWLAFVRQVAIADGMVTGVRKVAFDQGFELTWDELISSRLTYEDLGYTKMKGRQLERIYWNAEGLQAAVEKLATRKSKPHSSVAVQLQVGEKDSRSQGHCMQNLVVTQTTDRCYVDLYYRSTEITQKFLADLVLFSQKLPELFLDRKPSVVRFRFANVYLSAVFTPIFLRYEPDPLGFFEKLEVGDPKFYRTFGLATRRFFNETHNYTYRTRVKMFDFYKEHVDHGKMRPLVKKLSTLKGEIIEEEDEDV